MRVTVKAVNAALSGLGSKAELAKGAGYFFFRGGEADDWIDRTVAVPAIGSLTLEQWLNEYQRLKSLNGDMLKSATHASPATANAQKLPRDAPAREARAQQPPAHKAPAHARAPRKPRTHESPIQAPPPREVPLRDSNLKQACGLKAGLLADLDQVHKTLAAIEEQRVLAAREGRISDLVTLSAAAAGERGKFDHALLAIRDHTILHGCFQAASD